ncbi:MAG: hypothetical protein RQ783_04205 [Gammaproteobacteria bacterium]|nr:hypothetical protein [Gammaproteobacteria bacterium]
MNMRMLSGLILGFWASLSLAAQISEATVDRAWGLLIGDVITINVTLPVAYQQLDPAMLPQINKRYGTWLYLTALTAENKALTMTYQIVNVPTRNEQIKTPEFTIGTLNDDFVTIPSVALTLGSLLPQATDGAGFSKQPKPDRIPVLQDTRQLKNQLFITGVITLLLVAGLVLWHLGWRFNNRRPFAQAVHDLARLRWSRSVQPNQAARILHAAFNATAGTIVVQNTMRAMLNDVTWLQPLSDEIQQFYQQSEQHFFSRDAEQEPDLAKVMKLAKACRAKEKLA